jgi:hypothetical protein
MSKCIRDPTDEERSFFCKPIGSDCTDIVVVPSSSSRPAPQGRVAEMVNLLQSGGNFESRLQNRYKYKEKGITITVKKHTEQTEQEKICEVKSEDRKTEIEMKGKVIDYSDFIIEDENIGEIGSLI